MTGLFPVAFLDSLILNAASTNIPGSGSSPLEVVTQTVSTINGIHFIDTTGDFIGVYVGGSGNEKLRCILGGGQNGYVLGVFPIGSRISLRSMTTSAITAGSLACTFLGYKQYTNQG